MASVKVPIQRTPNTQVVAPQDAYQQPARPFDVSGLETVLRDRATKLTQDRDNERAAELQAAYVEEVNSLQQDFHRRKTEAPLGAENFTPTVLSDYEVRHQQMLGNLAAQGYTQSELNQLASRLGQLRISFGEQSLNFQSESQLARDQATGEKLGTQLSQYALNNPVDGYAQSVEESDMYWERRTDLSAPMREANAAKARDVIRQSAAQGLVNAHPELIIEKLDPNGFTAKKVGQGAGGAYEQVRGWQKVATDVAAQLGLDPKDVATVMSYETAGTFDPNIWGGKDKNYLGLIQFGPDERRQFGIQEGSTPEQWTAAILGFMKDRGFKPGMSALDFYSTILAGRPGKYNKEDMHGSVRENFNRAMSQHKDKATAWLSAGQEVPAEVQTEVKAAYVPVDVVTGIAVLDEMTGLERAQLLRQARERESQKSSSIKGAMDITIRNAVSSFMTTGDFGGPVLTKDEVLRAYGDLEGEQKWAEYDSARVAGQFIKGARTSSVEEIQADLEKLKPDPASPSYPIDQSYYAKAQEAAQGLLDARRKDPVAYVMSAYPEIRADVSTANTPEARKTAYAMLDRAFDDLGIPPSERMYLTKEGVEQVRAQYRVAGPAQKLGILSQLIDEMGTRAGRTLTGQGDKEVAGDFALYALLHERPNGEGILTEIFTGREHIAKDPARKPAPDQINKAFAGTLQATLKNLGGDYSRVLNEAASALYVARGGLTGKTSGGYAGWNARLYEDSLREVLGGTAGQSDTGIARIGPSGSDLTILPPGVTKGQMINWYERITNWDFARLSGGKQPRDIRGNIIPMYVLQDEGYPVLIAPELYGIKLGDGKFAQDGTGRPFTMRLTPKTMRGN